MSSGFADAFLPAEARDRERVMQETWGHLAPQKNKTYAGRIVYAVGAFGDDPLNPTMLVCEFKGLDDSPWFFDAVAEFIGSRSQENETGNVYEFRGTFRNYKFFGVTVVLNKYA